MSSTQAIEDQCAIKVGQVQEEARAYEQRRQEQILVERHLLAQTLDSLRTQMATEVGSLQVQAQERVYAEGRELAAKESSAHAAQLELHKELLRARVETEQWQEIANSFSVLESANAEDSSARNTIELGKLLMAKVLMQRQYIIKQGNH